MYVFINLKNEFSSVCFFRLICTQPLPGALFPAVNQLTFILSGHPVCRKVHPVHRPEDDVHRLRHRHHCLRGRLRYRRLPGRWGQVRSTGRKTHIPSAGYPWYEFCSIVKCYVFELDNFSFVFFYLYITNYWYIDLRSMFEKEVLFESSWSVLHRLI